MTVEQFRQFMEELEKIRWGFTEELEKARWGIMGELEKIRHGIIDVEMLLEKLVKQNDTIASG